MRESAWVHQELVVIDQARGKHDIQRTRAHHYRRLFDLVSSASSTVDCLLSAAMRSFAAPISPHHTALYTDPHLALQKCN